MYVVSNVVYQVVNQEEYNIRNIEVLESLVPYEGALKDIDLGENKLSLSNFDVYVPNNSLVLSSGDTSKLQTQNVVLGNMAGNNSELRHANIAIGDQVAQNLTGFNTHNVFLGTLAAREGGDIVSSVSLGYLAGQYSTSFRFGIAIGDEAGAFNTNTERVIFMGAQAGRSNEGSYCVGIGNFALRGNKGENVIGLGSFAGSQPNSFSPGVNSKDGVTIINNNSLPSYVNREAAVADLTVAKGCVSTNTYIYYNEATNAIEGVRL